MIRDFCVDCSSVAGRAPDELEALVGRALVRLSEVSLSIWELESLILLLFWAGLPRSPGGGGSSAWPAGLLGVMLPLLMAASACRRIIKVPDHPEALCFQIRGAAPPYVYAVGRGEWEPNRQGSSGDPSVCVIGVQSRPNHFHQACAHSAPLALTVFA